MHVAVGELIRVVPDALRGLGFSYPLADRATPMVVHGEIVHGLSLRFLAEQGAEIGAAAGRRLRLAERSAGSTPLDEIDASGKSLLEVGPRALDLVQGRMRTAAAAACLVKDTFGGFLVGELVARALARGRSLLVAFAARPGGESFEGNGVLLAFPDPNGGRIQSAGLDLLQAEGGRRLARLLGSQGDAGRLCSDLSGFLDVPPAERARLAIMMSRPSSPAQPPKETKALLATAPLTGQPDWCSVTDFKAPHADALQHGLEVDEAGWQALGSYIQRTRVRTSERSRAQAG